MKGLKIMKIYEKPSVDAIVLAGTQIDGDTGTVSSPF